MPSLLGLVTSGAAGGYQNPYVSEDLTAHSPESDMAALHGRSLMTAMPARGVTRHVALAPARAVSGLKSISFSDDFYHRIHVLPGELVLGNIASTQVTTVRLWNAFLTPENVLGMDGLEEGLSVTPPAALPMTLGALQETDWLVAVTPDGPSTLDATVRWVFEDAQAPALRISGNRIVPWGFVPDWSQPVVERLSWLTEILANSRGAEQRRSLRIAPRKTYEARFVAAGRERALFDLAMAGWGRKVWAIPVWPDVQLLAAPVPAGSLRITCRTEGFDFRQGGLAMLRGETAFDTEAVEIADVDATGLSLKRVTQQSWPPQTRLYPVRSARLTAMPETTRRTDSLLETEASFDLAEGADWPAMLPTATYRGRPVVEGRPDESKDLTHSYERLVLTLDNLTGLPAVTDTAGRSFVLHQHRWALAGRGAQAAWRSFMYGLRGRAVPVWVPTHAQDLQLAEAAAGSLLKVHKVGYARFGLGTPGRRDIRIERIDGGVLYRRITAAVENGPVEELSIDDDLPHTLQPEDVARISYMALCRLASDDVELQHLTDADGHATAAVSWRGVRDDLEAPA